MNKTKTGIFLLIVLLTLLAVYSCSAFKFPELVVGENLPEAHFFVMGNQTFSVSGKKQTAGNFINWRIKDAQKYPQISISSDGVLRGNFQSADIGKIIKDIDVMADDEPLEKQSSRLFHFLITAKVLYRDGELGNRNSPFFIQTENDFFLFNSFPSSYFAVTRDITVTPNTFVPLNSTINPFSGYLDGKNRTIRGVDIDGNRTRLESDFGFFGMTNGATIRDLNFLNLTIRDNLLAVPYVGGVVGFADKTFLYHVSINNVNIQVPRGTIGGLVGNMRDSTVSRCWVNGATLNGGVSGGFIGASLNDIISNIYITSNTNITGSGAAGGIVGLSMSSKVDGGYAFVRVNGGDMGAIVGRNNGTTISSMYYYDAFLGAGVNTNGAFVKTAFDIDSFWLGIQYPLLDSFIWYSKPFTDTYIGGGLVSLPAVR